MKNLFGLTPNALYGDEAPSEDGVKGRGRMHDLKGWDTRENPAVFDPPGSKREFFESRDSGYRIPRILCDLNEARPIHLGIIDGISTLNFAEGPWVPGQTQRIARPGVIICGLNPVATDAVGTAVMGFPNIRAPRGVAPFKPGDNHIVLAEQAGLGPATSRASTSSASPSKKSAAKKSCRPDPAPRYATRHTTRVRAVSKNTTLVAHGSVLRTSSSTHAAIFSAVV